jgi:hypothetical protein
MTVVTGDASGESALWEGVDVSSPVMLCTLLEDSMLSGQVLGVEEALAGAPVLQGMEDECALQGTCIHTHAGHAGL